MKISYLQSIKNTDNFPFSFGKAILKDEGYELHSHDYSELVIITGGMGLHTAEGETYSVGTGDIFVINRGQSHSFSRSRNLIMYNIGFQEKISNIEELESLPGIKVLFDLEPRSRSRIGFRSRFHAAPNQLEKIESIIIEMEREIRERPPGFQLVFRNLFINLAVTLARNYSDNRFVPGRKLMKIALCMMEIEEHFINNPDLKVLADKNGFSYSHFIRTFKNLYGIPPLQYILQLKLNKAVELLSIEDLNITEVSFECGFNDSNYFSRIFKKRFGISPREFRRKRRS